MSINNNESEFDDLFVSDEEDEFDDVVIEEPLIDVKKSSIGTLRYFNESKNFCSKTYKYPKQTKKLILNIDNFCKLLHADKVTSARNAFKTLPKIIQCMFLHKSNDILANKDKYGEKPFKNAFYIVKLFKTKDMSDMDVYSRYLNMSILRMNYEVAKKHFSVSKASKASKASKYSMEYQKRDVVNDTDASYIFYTSLYDEDVSSRLAITWLVEHGIYKGAKRKEIVDKYRKLQENDELIR